MIVNKLTIKAIYTEEEQDLLSDCTMCPRECRVNRFNGGKGFCGTDAGMNIVSICIHRGEEPPISGPAGICNIFFSGCNLRCAYCQNHEISRPVEKTSGNDLTLDETLERIERILLKGIKAVGFVSPSHVIPQVKAIIRGLKKRGHDPVMVYNTNSYDKQETIESLDGMIDVYLPDYKYVTPATALAYSDASDYPEIASKAIKIMYYQKGSVLRLDGEGRAENGILVRHLVLPGEIEESKKVMKSIADELSPGIHFSLMSQYHPTSLVKTHPLLKRSLRMEEYEAAVAAMEELGFRNGWTQDLDSYLDYRPDFSKEHPFE